jgi:hypothetical protein
MLLGLLQVALTGMLWGAGTAIGEVPPYLITYSAAAAGRKAEPLQEIEEVGGPACLTDVLNLQLLVFMPVSQVCV